jgi:putative hydrolase of HD superfamily
MTKPSDDTLRHDINFLYEMGNIRHIDRMWHRFGGINFASLSDHHFRVFWIAMMIAAHEGNVDTGKIAKFALVHDIAESRAGDVDYLARQYVERNEEQGIKDMLQGTAIEAEFLALWEEYEARESIEAKIVKDADNLDVDMELMEQAANGVQLKELWKDMRAHVGREKLYTETAKRMFAQIQDSNPHDWHLSGRNRITSGDWKKK